MSVLVLAVEQTAQEVKATDGAIQTSLSLCSGCDAKRSQGPNGKG